MLPTDDVSAAEVPPCSWFDAPQEAKEFLALAIEHWQDDDRSRQYVERALAAAADNVDVLVSAYRYFFYKADAVLALAIADRVIETVTGGQAWPADWEQDGWPRLVEQLTQAPDAQVTRLFLSAYSGKGLLLARLGDLDGAQLISRRVAELDARREFGARTLLEVLEEVARD